MFALSLIEERTGFSPHPGFSAVGIHGLNECGHERQSSRVGRRDAMHNAIAFLSV